MGDVLTFTLRPQPVVPPTPEPPSDADLRARIEAVAEAAVDTAEKLIAILDHIDGDPCIEDGADAEPSLAVPEHHHEAQTTWMRGNDGDREAEAAEITLPEVAILPAVPGPAWPLPWSGRANVITVAAVALIDLIERCG